MSDHAIKAIANSVIVYRHAFYYSLLNGYFILTLSSPKFNFVSWGKKAPSLDLCVPLWPLINCQSITICNPQRHTTPSDPSSFKLWIYSGLSRGERYLRLSWHRSDTERLLRLIPHTTVSGTVGQSPWAKLLLHDQQENDATSPVQRSPTLQRNPPSIHHQRMIGYLLSTLLFRRL